jgi:hypothetical protein
LYPRFFAYSKAAVTMRWAALRVMIRQLTASSGPGTLANALNLVWLFSAARTFSGGLVHSTPAYMPSVFCRNTVVSIFGSSEPPSEFFRM